MERNVVSVKIYGQEYNITGDKSREHIIKVADYVDRNMNEMAKVAQNAPVSALAILASINIADEYFETSARLETQEALNAQKEKDIEHYIQLWEEAKRNFTQFKDENAGLIEQRDRLKETIRERDRERDLIGIHFVDGVFGSGSKECCRKNTCCKKFFHFVTFPLMKI